MKRLSTRFGGFAVAVALFSGLVGACGGSSSWGGQAHYELRLPPNPHHLGSALPQRLPFSSGRGGSYWVDGAHGSDSARGTRKHPWRTIRHALAAVPLRGSVVNVLPGRYASRGQNYVIYFNRHGDVRDPVTLQAAKPGTVTVANDDPNTATNGAWIVRATGLRIRGFRFRLGNRSGSNVGANAMLIEDSDRIEVVDCTFNEVSLIGVVVRGGVGSTADDVWLIGNTFRPEGGDPTRQVTGLGYSSSEYFGSKGSHWVYAGQYGNEDTWERTSGVRRFVAVDNVLVGSAAGRDIQLGPQAQDSFVVDNTIYGNFPARVIGSATEAVYAGQGVQLFTNSSTPQYQTNHNVIANNLFLDLQGPSISGSGPPLSGNVALHNLSWHVAAGPNVSGVVAGIQPNSDGNAIVSLGARNRTADPRLADPHAYDFHPRPGSPALHAAAREYAYPLDATGHLRPARPAIGAFERACSNRHGC